MIREDAIRFIDAYVDNELDVKDALELQGWIEKDEACRAEYERVVALKGMLRGRLEGEGPVAPDLLKQRVKRALRREGLRQSVWFRPSVAAAAVITFMVFGWAGYQRAVAVPEPLVADTMMIYRVETGNPLDVKSESIRTVSTWLAGKFQQNVDTLELKGSLLGARLCPFAGNKGAMLRYRHKGKNLALFIGEASGIRYSLPMVASFRVNGHKIFEAQKEGFRLAFWRKGIWFYALVLEDGNGRAHMKDLLTQKTFQF
ncbi:MAG TPA: hypothetical protein DDZ83_09450 [Nitrospinae bacterium]|nr:hypothetical protein [Nitrospinota bacterium]